MIKIMYINRVSGGPKRFMSRLLKHMQDHEMIKVVQSGGDIYLSTIWSGDKPKRCKHVHRAASVYYDTNQKRRHGLNLRIARVVKSADYVIYQTKFAKLLHHKILRARNRHFSLINNGFDTSEYASTETSEGFDFVACSDWSNPAKRLKSIIQAFKKSKVDGRLLVIGPHAIKVKSSRISYTGSLAMEGIASYLKSKPFFVHLCYAESCPNVVVEALSFGCPVICNNIGGTPEIVGEDGVIVQCDKKFVFKRRKVDMSIKKLSVVTEGIRLALDKSWSVCRPDLSMETCATSYLNVFRQVLAT